MLLEVFVQALLLLPLLREILVTLRPVKRYHRKRNIKRESVCVRERERESKRERERERERDREKEREIRERQRKKERERERKR